MSYLLDTNACIALINAKPEPVRARFRKASDSGEAVYVSSVAMFELWYGVAKSARVEVNAARVEVFFAGPVQVLAFEDADARVTGSVRAALEREGRVIGAYDLLIAGQALQRKMTLVTANVHEFSRVKDLRWEDWGRK